ncbi:MAG TPA: AbrB family transcriptional regulator, partial [Dyella sp.]|uniref:AbrB family transcriptional regulator n=1 Tax=Dyella sp. TaxID=1869338 RepID=UPI002F957A8C
STPDWLAPVHAWPLIQTLALAVGGTVLARFSRIAGGPLLIPLVLGVLLSHLGLIAIELPPWLLALAYAFVGWGIGLRFNRPLLKHVARALPRVAACTLVLVLVCCAMAYGFVVFAGIDPLTAYLATSPGGADSVAIIAASTHVDVPFVMAMQTARFVAVIFLAPRMNRFLADRAVPSTSIDSP